MKKNYARATTNTRDYPILFDTEMVRAILSGAKTATRRLFKSPLSKSMEPAVEIFKESGKWIARLNNGKCYRYPILCPYGEPGDYLWVKETFANTYDCDDDKEYMEFKADSNDKTPNHTYCWTPSIHLRKNQARIWLKITDIKPQRILTITEDEAREEGISVGKILNLGEIGQVNFREGFIAKWISIYGIENYYENPWVWAIKFKLQESKPTKII
ncbi:MAG: hypothetical protein IPF54_27020 [Draconibacterium sp.]|nr:hypothetical protein [Draconibacterium sp.]